MIRFDRMSLTYPGAAAPALQDVTLHVGEGELCLVVGPTGAGKSTLLRAACGLAPHFTGGLLEGRVVVDGRDTRDHAPRDLADVVGVVLQDPATGFVADTVEEELAYGMEQLGVEPSVMRRRVEEVLDLLGLERLRRRALADLSGGEQQRVAIGAVLTSHPRVLVLDEPTSALDPAAAEEVLAALTRLVHDLGLTVLLAEHRLERVVQYADRIVVVDRDGRVHDGDPADVLVDSLVAPPIVELGRLAGWDPLPLSVRDARRRSAPLRTRLAGSAPDAHVLGATRPAPTGPAPLLSARAVHVRHGGTHAVRGVDLDLRPGEVVAVMGRNGAGKSSLLWALQGSGPRSAGQVLVDLSGAGTGDPARLRPRDVRRHVALVPQNPTDLLYLDSVGAECAASDRQAGALAGTTRTVLERLLGAPTGEGLGVGAATVGTEVAAGPTWGGGPGVEDHPRDLSEGQRLALVLAVQLAADPQVLLLDEPTRGLDYAAKERLASSLREHAAAGGAVLLSSHDVEFVAECASRVVVLADGEVVADGPAADVLVASPTFAPQVAKILHPLSLLTVADVRRTLAVTA
jgi:energy-coupling factor transport system ATP-binding protein